MILLSAQERAAAALRRFEIVLPDAAARDAAVASLRDAGHEVEEHDDGPLARDPSSNAFTLLVD
jgi:hypothetical protein